MSNSFVTLKFDVSLLANILLDMNLYVEHNDTFQSKLGSIAK
jgi:hypothetical protein